MITLKHLLGGGYGLLVKLYDSATSDICTMSIGDILLKRANVDLGQFITATRLLDIIHYIETGDVSFPFQNEMSRKVWGKEHLEEKGNQEFEALILSYRKNGFDMESLFEVDRDYILLNGTHRSACNLFFGYDEIKVKHFRRSSLRFQNPYPLLSLDLNAEFLESVFEAYENLQKRLIETGNPFLILATEDVYDKIYCELHHLVNVLRVSAFKSKDSSLSFNGKMIQFSLPCPDYSSEGGCVVSRYAQRMKKEYALRL